MKQIKDCTRYVLQKALIDNQSPIIARVTVKNLPANMCHAILINGCDLNKGTVSIIDPTTACQKEDFSIDKLSKNVLEFLWVELEK